MHRNRPPITANKRGCFFILTYDPLLALHLDETTIFTDLSSWIQNDLIYSVKDVVFSKISATDLIVSIIDETFYC